MQHSTTHDDSLLLILHLDDHPPHRKWQHTHLSVCSIILANDLLKYWTNNAIDISLLQVSQLCTFPYDTCFVRTCQAMSGHYCPVTKQKFQYLCWLTGLAGELVDAFWAHWQRCHGQRKTVNTFVTVWDNCVSHSLTFQQVTVVVLK